MATIAPTHLPTPLCLGHTGGWSGSSRCLRCIKGKKKEDPGGPCGLELGDGPSYQSQPKLKSPRACKPQYLLPFPS